jgi:hypothetical protein
VPVTDPDQPPGLSCGSATIGRGGFLAAARRHLRFNPSAHPAPEDLSRRVAVASANLPLQATAALYEAMGEAEITATLANRYADLIKAVALRDSDLLTVSHTDQPTPSARVYGIEPFGGWPTNTPRFDSGRPHSVPANMTTVPQQSAAAGGRFSLAAQATESAFSQSVPPLYGRRAGDVSATPDADRCAAIARAMVGAGRAQKSESEIVAILRLAQQGLNANAIATEMTRITEAVWPRSTVDRIIDRAASFGFRVNDTGSGVTPTAHIS